MQCYPSKRYDGPDGPKAPMDMKPWEREAVEQAARDKADKEETEVCPPPARAVPSPTHT